jgi:hypothetical protein
MLLPESGAFSTIRTRRGQSAPSIAIGPAGQLPECRLRPIGRTRRSRSRKPLVFLNLIAAGRPRRTELQVHILVFGYIAVEANPAGESSLRRRADPQPEAAHHPAQAQLDIVVLRPQKFARCRSARTSCADSGLQSTGRTPPSRIAGRCNGVFAERSTSNAFVTRRVSSSSSIKSGFRMSVSIHCGSGPASSLIRAIVKSRPRNHSITTSGSPPPWPLARSPARDHDAHARAFQ